MDRIAFASESERRKLFIDASDKISLTDFIVEKDFWVSWVLAQYIKPNENEEHSSYQFDSLFQCPFKAP
jgi:hypothetical protein